jgi:hypothetical protein
VIRAEFVTAKTTHSHFSLGARFGFATAILKPRTHIAAHGKASPTKPLDQAWEFEPPERPESYDHTAVGGITNATRQKKEAMRNKIIKE